MLAHVFREANFSWLPDLLCVLKYLEESKWRQNRTQAGNWADWHCCGHEWWLQQDVSASGPGLQQWDFLARQPWCPHRDNRLRGTCSALVHWRTFLFSMLRFWWLRRGSQCNSSYVQIHELPKPYFLSTNQNSRNELISDFVSFFGE